MKKPSMKEYEEIGIEFKLLHDRLIKLSVYIGTVLPKKHGRKISDACDLLDMVRSDVEDNMFKHYPDESTTHIFYGQ